MLNRLIEKIIRKEINTLMETLDSRIRTLDRKIDIIENADKIYIGDKLCPLFYTKYNSVSTRKAICMIVDHLGLDFKRAPNSDPIRLMKKDTHSKTSRLKARHEP